MTSHISFQATVAAFLAIAAAVSAIPSPASAEEPSHALDQIMAPVFNEAPISIGTFQSLTPETRLGYLQVTVEALNWSGEFNGCATLTPTRLGEVIEHALETEFASAAPASPLMNPLVFSAMQICSTDFSS